jgi:hypothetical protein
MRKILATIFLASFLILTLSQSVVAQDIIKPEPDDIIKPESDVLYTTVHIKGYMKGGSLIIPLAHGGYTDTSDVTMTHKSNAIFQLVASVVGANLIIELPVKMPGGFYQVEAILYF